MKNLKNNFDVELLAPAGNFEKLKTAIYFGADAVYVGGKQFGLRAGANNFTEEELKEAVNYAHERGKKVFVTINIFAKNFQFAEIKKYVKVLERINVDAVIVSDLGVLKIVRENTKLEIHISTQANVVNKFTAEEYIRLGASRIILARETTIDEIKEISKHLMKTFGKKIDLECFVHGAMCISYSGRCLLSNVFTGRESNMGACVQSCRWKFNIVPERNLVDDGDAKEEEYPITQDENGTYILNSKDLCLVEHLDELKQAGITSFKIEGRMKSPYYVATVVNSYRRKMKNLTCLKQKEDNFDYVKELQKTANREFTTGFTFNDANKENLKTSKTSETHKFVAVVLGNSDNYAYVEMRNRFKIGDVLEVLSPNENFNKSFIVGKILNEKGLVIDDAKNVQEKLNIECPFKLNAGDILRLKKEL